MAGSRESGGEGRGPLRGRCARPGLLRPWVPPLTLLGAVLFILLATLLAPCSAKREDPLRGRGLLADEANAALPLGQNAAAALKGTRPATILELLESRQDLSTFTRRVYDFPDLQLFFSDPNTSITLVRRP